MANYVCKTERSIRLGDNCSATISRYDGSLAVHSADYTEHVNVVAGAEPMFQAIRAYCKEARWVVSGDAADWADKLSLLIETCTESIRELQDRNPEAFADASEEVTA